MDDLEGYVTSDKPRVEDLRSEVLVGAANLTLGPSRSTAGSTPGFAKKLTVDL